jgi:hypothetical protein
MSAYLMPIKFYEILIKTDLYLSICVAIGYPNSKTKEKEHVRLSFQSFIFSQSAAVFSHINQATVLSAAYFQPKRTSPKNIVN